MPLFSDRPLFGQPFNGLTPRQYEAQKVLSHDRVPPGSVGIFTDASASLYVPGLGVFNIKDFDEAPYGQATGYCGA